MGKLNSGRVKRFDQSGITSDRYQFLGLEQAEPNLGDPLVGPSSVGANPIPVGSYYQLAAIGEKVGERYWTTPVGIGTTLGIISVYDNGFLPNNAFSRIHGLNFVGSGVTVEVPPVQFIGDIGIATIRIAVTDILNQGEVGQVLFNSPSGFVYGAPEFYYNSSNGNVGIGSTIPTESLDVNGNIKTQIIKIEGTLEAQGSSGLSGQYLKSTGTGLVWDDVPQTNRIGFTTIATINQSIFTFNYNVDIVDFFINGIRLNETEFIVENGTSITLNEACFGGEIIDIITYEYLNISNIVFGGGGESYWEKTSVGIHTLSNVGIGTTNPTEELEVSGTIKATSFIGNGSGLIGLLGVGSGVEIQENGSPVGTAATINFGSNLDISFADGVVTVSGASSVSAATTAFNLAGTPNLNVGVVTATSFVGNLTGIASLATYTSEWILGAVGSSDYTFTGPGFTGAESDPVLYLVRGQQYKFTNTMGAHPFRIQSTVNGSTGTQYDDGIVNNNVSNGTLTWNVQFDAPGLLYYQCTAHGSMGGKIYIIDATGDYNDLTNTPENLSDFNNDVGFTTFSPLGRISITRTTSVLGVGQTADITFSDGFSEYNLLKASTSDGAWITIYTDTQSRTNDITRSIDTDPLPGSGVIAELITTGVGITTQRFTPGVIGYNDDPTVSNNIYVKIVNNSGITTAITITLTISD